MTSNIEHEFHIMPTNDIKKHYPMRNCKCKPSLTNDDNSSILLTHHSYDGREGLEMANESMGVEHSNGCHKWELIRVDFSFKK